jgi:hypothetical protein
MVPAIINKDKRFIVIRADVSRAHGVYLQVCCADVLINGVEGQFRGNEQEARDYAAQRAEKEHRCGCDSSAFYVAELIATPVVPVPVPKMAWVELREKAKK